jgi:hypothetical protein
VTTAEDSPARPALTPLRQARERFLTGRPLPDGVPDEVVAAWRRARFFGVPHDLKEPAGPVRPVESALLSAVRPVLERLAPALAAGQSSLVLTHERRRVLWSAGSTPGDEQCRDLSEQEVGHNSAALALRTRRRAEVHGPEHFLDLWQEVSAVSVPVLAPENGQVLGTVTVVSGLCAGCTPHPGAALAEATATAVEAELLARSRTPERLLLDAYQRAASRPGTAVVALDGRNRLLSEAAAVMVSPEALAMLERNAAASGAGWGAAGTESYGSGRGAAGAGAESYGSGRQRTGPGSERDRSGSEAHGPEWDGPRPETYRPEKDGPRSEAYRPGWDGSGAEARGARWNGARPDTPGPEQDELRSEAYGPERNRPSSGACGSGWDRRGSEARCAVPSRISSECGSVHGRPGLESDAYDLVLPDGVGTAHVTPIRHRGAVIGVVAVLESPIGDVTRPVGPPPVAPVALAGRSVPWRHAATRAAELARSREPLLLTGERGTGKTALVRELLTARGDPDPLVVDAAEGPVDELARWAGALAEDRVLLLRHAERLAQPDVAALNSLLDVRPGAPLLVTYTPGTPPGPCLQRLLDTLAARSVTLPALRERPDDIKELLPELAPRSTPGRPPLTWTLDALRALEQHPWPGNVTELAHLVRALAEQRRAAGPVRRTELPDAVREGPAARRLSPMEHAERTAILEALRRHGGNKARAAAALGIARATLYRKLRGYRS